MAATQKFLTENEDNRDDTETEKLSQCCLAKAALTVRLALQWFLFKHGCFIQNRPFETLFLGTVLMGLSCTGLKGAVILTDIGTLWIPRMNMANRNDLMLHAQVMEDVSKLSVEMYGVNWTMSDICFKPPVPPIKIGELLQKIGLGEFLELLFAKMMPCILITPLDCFWDGARPLGPHPSMHLHDLMKTFIEALPEEDLSWKNFHPMDVFEETSSIINVDLLLDSFTRAGVGSGYLRRPCINPFHRQCPSTAPNFQENFCEITEKFVSWNQKQPIASRIKLAEKIPEAETPETNGDDYNYDYYGDESATESETCTKYKDSVRQILNSNVSDISDAFLRSIGLANSTDYAKILSNGCPGVGPTYLHWPASMILGGIVNDRQNQSINVEALQTIMIMAGGTEVFKRYKDCSSDHICHMIKTTLNEKQWSPHAAEKVIKAWQRKFVNFVYDHPSNKMQFQDENSESVRVVHPLSATSLEDMLKQFSKFKPLFLLISYMLMLLYAGFCLFSSKKHGIHSCSGLAIFGVLLVTFASASGLGFSSIVGSKFNAATTQIVPFLTLGLGVDDMFLLVHNYKDVACKFTENELGHLLRKTGLSVLLTSINNVLAFLAGSLVNVPAMKDFCMQTAILLFFNVLAILTMYPAMMSVDLMRRKNQRVDVFCCVQLTEKAPSSAEMNGASSPVLASSQNGAILETKGTQQDEISLQSFVTNVYGPLLEKNYVKVIIVCLAGLLLSSSIFGLCMGEQGLDLTDVVPRDTAPYSFLEAREKYFSFYPMFSVIKGPIDFPEKQKQISEFRDEMENSKWAVASQGKLGQYWLGLLKDYLTNLQNFYQAAIKNELINGTTVDKKASFEAKLAYKLICNTGEGVNCSRNEDSIEFVDKNGLINKDGFYKYITVFYNLDNIMYYVSQANFYPAPPKWTHQEHLIDQESMRFPLTQILLNIKTIRDGGAWMKFLSVCYLVPAAYPPLVSQIPFYLNGLVDTTETVKAIKELRIISENFTENGLPNFPQGIPFTFWEQYFYLIRNFLTDLAIITSCVYVVISVLLMSPWAAAIVVGIILMMVAELCGFMGLVGLKLNPISAVSLITAVTHGGISTVLGVIVLAFSEFEFIVRYFFMVMAGLIVIGLLNGLILLPVVLSLIGPPPEPTLDCSTHSRFLIDSPILEPVPVICDHETMFFNEDKT